MDQPAALWLVIAVAAVLASAVLIRGALGRRGSVLEVGAPAPRGRDLGAQTPSGASSGADGPLDKQVLQLWRDGRFDKAADLLLMANDSRRVARALVETTWRLDHEAQRLGFDGELMQLSRTESRWTQACGVLERLRQPPSEGLEPEPRTPAAEAAQQVQAQIAKLLCSQASGYRGTDDDDGRRALIGFFQLAEALGRLEGEGAVVRLTVAASGKVSRR
jgi:hypothetical protein